MSKSKRIICIISILILLIIVVLLIKPVYRRTLNIRITCANSKHSVYYDGNNYYYIQPDGIYELSNGNTSKVISTDKCIQLIGNDEYLVCYVESSTDVILYDKHTYNEVNRIAGQENICMLGLSDDSLLCYDFNSSSYDSAVFALSLNTGAKADISENMKSVGADMLCYNETPFFILRHFNSIYSVYSDSIFRHTKTTSAELLYADNNTVIYTPNFNVNELEITKIPTSDKKIISISDNTYFCGTAITLVSYDKDNMLILAGNSASPYINSQTNFSYSDELKYHKYDVVSVFDTQLCELKNEKKFRTFERVIYIDSKKAITYYKGEYLTYSLDNWEITNKQKAEEINSSGRYTFEICGEYVFVFDNSTGELINTIPV